MTPGSRLAAAALALTFAITGCGGAAPAKDDNPPAGSNADKTTPKAKAKPKPAEQDLSSLKFGDTAKWPDGLSITVSKPVKFTPGEYAAGMEGKNHVKVTITVVNKTSKPVKPSLFYPTVQSGDQEASAIYDHEAHVGDMPRTTLLKGRQAKWVMGFSVKNPKDIVLEIKSPRPTFTSDSAIFSS